MRMIMITISPNHVYDKPPDELPDPDPADILPPQESEGAPQENEEGGGYGESETACQIRTNKGASTDTNEGALEGLLLKPNVPNEVHWKSDYGRLEFQEEVQSIWHCYRI
jgi:hypothetical protein